MARLREEFRRRELVIRIFPNVDSVQRLRGALRMEQHEIWSTARKCVSLAATGHGAASGHGERQDAKGRQGMPDAPVVVCTVGKATLP